MPLGVRALLLFLLAGCGDGQGTPPEGPDARARLEVCATSVEELLATAMAQAPTAGSGGYRMPDAPARDDLAQSLAVARDDAVEAERRADAASYRLCVVSGDDLFVWMPLDASLGHAFIAYRPAAPRGVIVEVPHPFFDVDTATEALAVFDGLDARALIVAGTHRCANTGEPSGCDGTTSACGANAPYPTSDMAHTTESFFQVAHEVLAERHVDDWILSLHGMAGDGVHVSNGTTLATTGDAPVARIAAALAIELPDETIASCNDHPGATTTASLCGTTNTQGRHVNGAASACTDAATHATGRFLHLEQSSSVRGRTSAVAAAIDAVAP